MIGLTNILIMENNFDILIPGQHQQVADTLLELANNAFHPSSPRRVAIHVASGKYWEAYDCKDDSRQEYWRQVMICLDVSEPLPSSSPVKNVEEAAKEWVRKWKDEEYLYLADDKPMTEWLSLATYILKSWQQSLNVGEEDWEDVSNVISKSIAIERRLVVVINELKSKYKLIKR